MFILLVEDDEIIASGLVYALEGEGYKVKHCAAVKSAITAAREEKFNLAILDLTLPDGSGYEVYHELRKQATLPVIFLTAIEDEGNIVKALEMGGEDYIIKPFRLKEFLARIKVVLRRTSGSQEEKMDCCRMGNLTIYPSQGKVYREETELTLTPLEYRLLLTFVRHKGQILSRSRLLEAIWDVEGNFVNDNTLTVCVKRLREKIQDDPHDPKIIQTVRGIGYKASEPLC